MNLTSLAQRTAGIALGTATLALAGCALYQSRSLALEAQPTTSSLAEDADSAHAAAFADTPFPSASECRVCHEDHYREWSVSPHAYAQISPVFNAFNGTLVKANNGSFGDFCIRCHTPVGMALGEPVFTHNAERSPVSLEGVTCVVCHRQNQSFGKSSGRIALNEGDIHATIFGPRDNEELRRVLDDAEAFGVVTERGQPGRKIHADAEEFFELTTPGFCGTCHDVTFINGFRLEEAFSEYKQSPAAKRGETCHDCHMGVEPGIASGYREEPAAVIGGKPTGPRKRTNHMFIGPDYSIVHPGIFPHNPEVQSFATAEEWLEFDWRAGWGTDEFEDQVQDDSNFPDRWSSIDDRYDARDLLEGQLALLEEADRERVKLLQRGYVLGDVDVSRNSSGNLAVAVRVENGTDGHNAPTGFVAERLVFLRVTLRDSEGNTLFESGDLDPNGDVRDQHSLYVHNGELPADRDLFSLQSHFLTRNLRGGEREQVLAVNYSLSPLPFARPATRSNILTGRPDGARIHKKGIEPGGHRTARYAIDAALWQGRGPCTLTVELVAGMVPVNLVHAISGVGFEYGLSPRDVAERIVDGHRVLAKRELVIQPW